MKKKVLIVDDDVAVREALEKLLLGTGYEVVLAADGQAALDLVGQHPIDLLLLDLGLPLVSGWDAFESITREHPLMPIIIITGQVNKRDAAMAAGVGALMEKPLDVSLLLETIRQLLSESQRKRLRRLCGYINDFRYVPCESTLLLKQLREQHSERFRFKFPHSQTNSGEM
jgi:DNA-binding response OmpR family regulator